MQPYKKLFTYWFALIIYDLTVDFTKRNIKSYKLREQMDGAARSGKQNIVEGSEGMQTSLKSAIKLTGVAKASFEELIGDLEDFLRQRNLERWSKNDQRVVKFRGKSAKLVKQLASSYKDESLVRNLSSLSNLRKLFEFSNSEEEANLLLTLCHQETFLLNRQVLSIEKKHKTEGGHPSTILPLAFSYCS
ncbi:four helix bundle protein [Patescibacteria group bacterium]